MTELTKTALAAKVEEGLNKKQLAEHYDVPDAEMARMLKFFNLKLKRKGRKKEPKYRLIDDTPSSTVVEKYSKEQTV